MLITQEKWLGENRAITPALLPDGAGVVSLNHKPTRGDLRPWRAPLTVATVPAGQQTIYRMGRDVISDVNYWLSWPSVVHAVRGFDVADTTERTYYTGDGIPKVTDNIMALGSPPYPTSWRPLGLPVPAVALGVSAPASTDATALKGTYFYLYTYANDWGWESAPSAPSAKITRTSDVVTNLTNFIAPPAGNYGINRMRVYRTQQGAAGNGDYFFLREVPIGTTSTTDDNRLLAEQLTTTRWLTPPVDLVQLTPMWNGMLAGISGGVGRMCVPYTPYAWPVAYDIKPPDSKVVGFGVFGQSMLVLTTGRPLLVAGSAPDAMDQRLLEIPQSCVSARSIVGMGIGVAWASPDGLCFYGPVGLYGSMNAKVVTRGIFTRDDWQAIRPETIIGQMYEGLYMGSYDDGSGARKGFLMDMGNTSGVYMLDAAYTALHFDNLADSLFVLQGTNIGKWDAGTPMTVTFTSKRFYLPKPTQAFSCAEVVALAYPVAISFSADGVTYYSTNAVDNNGFRLPGGFYAQIWQFSVNTTGAVQIVSLAHSMAELAQA